ncbi:MAG: hypothetical protein JW827_00250 [Spirochaetes bacterium]|nr:hypothetical protein [Spirochaetota bacterium]
MKKILLILFTLLLIFSAESWAQQVVLFYEPFTNLSTSNLLSTNNVRIVTNLGTNYVQLDTIAASITGYVISTNIVLLSNYKWEYIDFSTKITNSSGGSQPRIFIIITNGQNWQTYTINTPAGAGFSRNGISFITSGTIQLKAVLQANSVPPPDRTPFINFLRITATNIPEKKEGEFFPLYTDRFYGAPSPFKKEDDSSAIRFYYDIKEAGRASLKIYDINYNLVRIIQSDEPYFKDSTLNATWDGKNGKGILVLSGVYVAILEFTKDSGGKEKPDPFIFAVIR